MLVTEVRFPRSKGPPMSTLTHIWECRPRSLSVDRAEHTHLPPSHTRKIHAGLLIVQDGRFPPGNKAGLPSNSMYLGISVGKAWASVGLATRPVRRTDV